MREIVRCAVDQRQQYAAIDWNTDNAKLYELLLLDSNGIEDMLSFNNDVEILYKKWLLGEAVILTNITTTHTWNVEQQLVPQLLLLTEKNEYLARKVQKKIQQQYNTIQADKFTEQLTALTNQLATNTSAEAYNDIVATAKAMDEQLRNAVAATKNITLEQKWVENGIDNEAYLKLKGELNQLFDKLKEGKSTVHHNNYNLIAPRVEALYALSKIESNFGETRKELIALQKEVVAMPLERWQKNELMDRLRSAFDLLNTKQDAQRQTEDARRLQQTEALQKQYDLILPQATNTTFAEGFALLKDLQDLTNKTSILRDKREHFYQELDAAFKTIKEKADSENDSNYSAAVQHIEAAIATSKQTDLFKDARQILITAQNELKEIRLSRKQKDELFTKLRLAFDELNIEQDKFFAEKRKENSSRLEDALQHLKRILARKKEGIEVLYNAKANAESKTLIIKADKKSDGTIFNQFNQKANEIAVKITEAEKDIVQLEKKVDKMEKELEEIRK